MRRTKLTIALACCLLASLAGNNVWAQNPQPAAQQNEPLRWSTKLNFDRIDVNTLQRRLAWFGLKVPINVAGTATVKLEASIPLSALRTAKAYKVDGQLLIEDLWLDQSRFKSLSARLRFENGVLTLEDLELLQQDGSVNGSASLELSPQDAFEATLTADKIDIAPIVSIIQQFGLLKDAAGLQGRVDAAVDASGNVATITDTSTWTIEGSAAIRQLRRAESPPWDIELQDLQVGAGSFSIQSFSVLSADRNSFFVNGSVSGTRGDSPELNAKLNANDLSFQDVFALLGDSSGSPVDGKLDFKGDLVVRPGEPQDSAPRIMLQAAVASPQLRVFGVDLGMVEHDLLLDNRHVELKPRRTSGDRAMKISELSADLEVSDDSLRASNLRLKAFGGQLDGDVAWSRVPEVDHQVKVDWRDLALSVSRKMVDERVALSASTSGTAEWACAADKLDRPWFHRGHVRIGVAGITVNGDTVGGVDVSLYSEESLLTGDVAGDLFDGQVAASAEVRTTPTDLWNDLAAKVRLTPVRVEGASLRSMLDVTRIRSPVDGTIDVAVDVRSGSSWLSGAEINLNRLTVGGSMIAERIESSLRREGDVLVLERLNGRLAGGKLIASGKWSLGDGPRQIQLTLNRAVGEQILLPLDAGADRWLRGTVSLRTTVTGSASKSIGEMRADGYIRVVDGCVFGMPIGDAHTPLVVSLGASDLRLSFPQVDSKIADGRLQGDLAIHVPSWGRSGFHLASRWRLNHVDFETLLDESLGTSTIGQGDLTGEMKLGGRWIRNAKDLRGDFRFRLGGSDASAVPGLSTAGVLLGAGALTGVRFENGVASGRVARGDIVIKELALTSDRVAVYADGRVGVLDQRMDVTAKLMTGDFQGQTRLLRYLGGQAIDTVVPFGRVNRLLSNRTVVVEARGSVRSPIVQLLTGETLRENATRFAVDRVFDVVALDGISEGVR